MEQTRSSDDEVIVRCQHCGKKMGTLQTNAYAIIQIIETHNSIPTNTAQSQAICLSCIQETGFHIGDFNKYRQEFSPHNGLNRRMR